jgi:nucleoside-diphosphate-sugar epimerase
MMASNKNFLVTGGTGFLGSALARRLLADGHRVRVFDNNSRGSARRLHDILGRVELIEGDIRDAAAVEHACEGIDSICHLAFVNGTEFFYSNPDLVLDVGVRGMLNVLDGGARHHVPELILASSSEVYQTPPTVPTDETVPLSIPDPLNPRYSYGGGKIISELLALHCGARTFKRIVIFRPHNVYGPDMGLEHVIPQFARRMVELVGRGTRGTLDFPIQGTGSETRAFIYIDDFTAALARIIEKGEHRGIYHIGTDQEVDIATLAREVAHCFGGAIRIKPGELKKGGTPRRCPDISKLKALGFAPAVSLQEGLERTVGWYAGETEPKRRTA